MRNTLLACLFVVLFSGCASVPAGNKPRLAPRNTRQATVYLINGIGGIKVGGEMMAINGVKAGTLDRREYTWFYATPGTLRLSFNDPMMTGRALSARTFDLAAGKTYFIKYDISGSPQNDASLLFEAVTGASRGKDNFKPEDIQPISEAEASRMIESFKLVGNEVTK